MGTPAEGSHATIARSLGMFLQQFHNFQDSMAFVVGPRQVGKTTLARALQAGRGSQDLYRNWDDLAWRREFARSPYGFIDSFRPQPASRPLIVLDEIHKHPRWKQYLKGLFDTRRERADILVTGSGRLDYYQKGGDSLLGRYHQYRMHPLSVRELTDPQVTPESYDPADTVQALAAAEVSDARQRAALDDLLAWGGFPRMLARRSTRLLRLWHAERKRLIMREDVRDLVRSQSVALLELLAEMLSDRVGSLLSLNALAEDLGVSQPTVAQWVEVLERLYYVYTVRPYHRALARAARKARKAYLWDWSEVDQEGPRLENLIASHLLKWCHFTADFGYRPLDLRYVRDKEQREIDFLLTLDRKPWMSVEVKAGHAEASGMLERMSDLLGVEHRFLVVGRHLDRNGSAGAVRVMDAASFLGCLPV